MRNKLKSILFKVPLVALVVISFLVSVYLAITKSYNVNFFTPLILGILILLYIIGMIIERKSDF